MAKYSNTLLSNSSIRKFPIRQIYVYLDETDLISSTWANDHLIFSVIIYMTKVVLPMTPLTSFFLSYLLYCRTSRRRRRQFLGGH